MEHSLSEKDKQIEKIRTQNEQLEARDKESGNVEKQKGFEKELGELREKHDALLAKKVWTLTERHAHTNLALFGIRRKCKPT